MRRANMKEAGFPLWAAFLALILGLSAQSLRGQGCKEIVYGHENQIDPRPIELRQVKGKGTDPSGTVMPQLCVGVFTEPEHRLVRYTQSDENGIFVVDTKGLPDGEYRLVGQSAGFCPANARIRIKFRSHKKKPLAVHMNVHGIDTCSYVELSKQLENITSSCNLPD